MKYVLDSSVAFKAVVPEINSDKAIKLIHQYRAAVHELVAPDILPVLPNHLPAGRWHSG